MTKSISAYRDAERVRRYDADMDLLHPNRHKMVDVAVEVLPFRADEEIVGLDLGVGTGYFTERLLRAYAKARVIAVDGSEAMIDLAATRLRSMSDRVTFVTSGFDELARGEVEPNALHLIFSSYALHHLDVERKRALLRVVVPMLKPGGWILNADLVSNPDPDIERIIQNARTRGIVARNAGKDARFNDAGSVRTFLDGLEESEGDQPLTIAEDIALMTECGIGNATVFWQEYREVVYGGTRSKP